ncbi:hypothetical protein C8F04DRAFT_1393733 [Mycena alexandri]|uniref:Carbohydrate-binding module family 19 domain-containing protein n=1 Tax=Mycena alexandri TaxID=1745969 RepID=A0AAD6T1B6_9AGAR|nr:hypothetical protein C8F04DRAFT_1393733 [Mycena alexandri]
MHSFTLITLALAAAASARPRSFGRRADFTLKNGQDAIALNDKFKTLTATSSCTAGQDACVNQQFAQCVGTTFTLQPCAGGTICAALPLVNSAGTSITCTTQADLDARIAATGATAASAPPAAAAPPPPAAPPAAAPPAAAPPAAAAPPPAAADSGDLQQSLTVDSSVLQTTDDGQNPPVTGQAAAQTSKNNFINFCVPTLKNLPITNGLQITTGSCNPTPIGQIPSTANIPSAKFQSPTNGATLKANTPFNITLQAKNIQLGKFTNAAKTYFANPQTLNAQGQIIGHTHIVIEAVDSLASTAVTDATKFLFFKGINDAADAQGNVQATVAAGLPAGTYRMGTIMSSATHQPVIVPIAQHGICDDVIYMTIA